MTLNSYFSFYHSFVKFVIRCIDFEQSNVRYKPELAFFGQFGRFTAAPNLAALQFKICKYNNIKTYLYFQIITLDNKNLHIFSLIDDEKKNELLFVKNIREFKIKVFVSLLNLKPKIKCNFLFRILIIIAKKMQKKRCRKKLVSVERVPFPVIYGTQCFWRVNTV